MSHIPESAMPHAKATPSNDDTPKSKARKAADNARKTVKDAAKKVSEKAKSLAKSASKTARSAEKKDQANQIGRASFREQVRQYVSISVAAVYLKTKQHTTYHIYHINSQ